ncbi:MAG: hypothetical protein ABR564_07380 [Candidatus Dormibacteria bacterium]
MSYVQTSYHRASPVGYRPLNGGGPVPKFFRHLIAVAALTVLSVAGLASMSATVNAAIAFTQCDSIDNAAAASVSCDVTVVNNLNLATGATSSTVSVTSTLCSPLPGNCVTSGPTTTSSTQLVTSIDQCNGSANKGGSTVKCTANVTNNIVGNATTTPATVNQCNGSGGGGGSTMLCIPFPASTTNADITQCNGSATGGGTYNGEIAVNCTVSPSTTSPALPVTINQCNGSSNGGGSSVACKAGITNNITAASSTSTPTPSPTQTSTSTTGFGITSVIGSGGPVAGLGSSSGAGSAGTNISGSHPVVINGRTFAAAGSGSGSFVSQGVRQAPNTGGAPPS